MKTRKEKKRTSVVLLKPNAYTVMKLGIKSIVTEYSKFVKGRPVILNEAARQSIYTNVMATAPKTKLTSAATCFATLLFLIWSSIMKSPARSSTHDTYIRRPALIEQVTPWSVIIFCSNDGGHGEVGESGDEEGDENGKNMPMKMSKGIGRANRREKIEGRSRWARVGGANVEFAGAGGTRAASRTPRVSPSNT